MFVDIILSHRTRDEQTAAAWDNLLKRFGSWEAVRDAPTEQVQDAIANVNWPEVKAPRFASNNAPNHRGAGQTLILISCVIFQ